MPSDRIANTWGQFMPRSFNILNKWILPILLTVPLMGADMSSAQGEQPTSKLPWVRDAAQGRDFRELSIHPNGQDWLFEECTAELDPNGDCAVLRYNSKTKRLQRYELPEGYIYLGATFSPTGKYVVMTRVSKAMAKSEGVRDAHEQTEIVLMNADGTGLKVVSLSKGHKVGPIMSPDESRIAYWRAALRPPGSKTFSSHFNIWEVNLATGEDRLFAGPFSFFDRSGLQYLSNDMLLVGADGPQEYAQDISSYWKKYNRSSVYRIPRGVTALPPPILTEVEGANQPSSDQAGNLYFEGQRPKISLFRKSLEGTIEQWIEPYNDIARMYSAVCAPDGSYVTFIYEVKGTRPRDGKRGIGVLDTRTSEWSGLNIPPIQSSQPITVKTGH
jgi:hypothetical protein